MQTKVVTYASDGTAPLESHAELGGLQRVNVPQTPAKVGYSVETVDLFAQLPQSYPEGEAIFVKEANALYIFDGVGWVHVGEVAKTRREEKGNRRREAVEATKKKRSDRKRQT
jgi:hypothetical protein